MDFSIDKITYADGLAYRYQIRDAEGDLLFIADRSGMLLPSPTRLVEFFDPERNMAARLQLPDVLPWQRATRYEVFVGEEPEPYALVFEKWRLVDLLLLRMPRYTVELGENRYAARGNRYGGTLCEIRLAPEEAEIKEPDVEEYVDEPEEEPEQAEKEAAEEVEVLPLDELVATAEEDEEEDETPEPVTLATIERPAMGANYAVAVEAVDQAAPLQEDLFALASLAILIDMELFS